jgi:hypothetical protein
VLREQGGSTETRPAQSRRGRRGIAAGHAIVHATAIRKERGVCDPGRLLRDSFVQRRNAGAEITIDAACAGGCFGEVVSGRIPVAVKSSERHAVAQQRDADVGHGGVSWHPCQVHVGAPVPRLLDDEPNVREVLAGSGKCGEALLVHLQHRQAVNAVARTGAELACRLHERP